MSDQHNFQTPVPEELPISTALGMMSTDNATVAFFQLEIPGLLSRRYAGDAKRHPKDAPDMDTGALLAASRALADASEELAQMAQDRIDAAARRKQFQKAHPTLEQQLRDSLAAVREKGLRFDG